MKQKCKICSIFDLQQITLYGLQFHSCKQCNYIVLSTKQLFLLPKLILMYYTKTINIPINSKLTLQEKQRFLYFKKFFEILKDKHRIQIKNNNYQCGICFKYYKQYRYYNILNYYYCKHNPIYLLKGQQNAGPSIWIQKQNFQQFVQFVINKCKNKKFYFSRFIYFIYSNIKKLIKGILK